MLDQLLYQTATQNEGCNLNGAREDLAGFPQELAFDLEAAVSRRLAERITLTIAMGGRSARLNQNLGGENPLR